MIPSPGRIVQYTISEGDATIVNYRRDSARTETDWQREYLNGTVIHSGNSVKAGDCYPLIITRVWDDDPTEDSSVNGQVMLDGNDTLWVTSVLQGDGPWRWREYPRI